MNKRQPIVISGMGAVTPYGAGIDRLWRGLLQGSSTISAMDLFDLGGLSCTQAGLIRKYPASLPVFDRSPRALRFAAAASLEALTHAGLWGKPELLAETALVTASNFGDIDTGEAAWVPPDLEEHDPTAAGQCAAGAPAAALAQAFHLGGVRVPIALSCASGAAAVAVAADLISGGVAKRVLAVGFDALSRFAWSGLCSLRTMTKEKIRPFDANRSGTIFAEGAGAVVLESASASLARHGGVEGWLCGWATGNNGHHLTAPAARGAGSYQVMREALEAAGFEPDKVDHINAHGTGTKANDLTETQAFYDLFGPRAAEIPVTSVKSSLGHTLGAGGALELIASVLTLAKGTIPPTVNYETPDPACPLKVVTAPCKGRFECVLSNSAGFGGCNAALVVTRHPSRSVTETADAEEVVVTGAGLVSALGVDRAECQAAWREGESACFPLGRFDYPDVEEPPEVGEVPEIDLQACGVTPKPYLDPASRYLLAACGQAMGEAGLDAASAAARQMGVAVGTAWGCCETAERFFEDYMRKGPRLVKPFLFPHTYANTAVSLAAMEWSLKGPHCNAVSGGSASGLAFASAVAALRAGRTDAMAAGGCDALSPTRFRANLRGAKVPLGEAAGAVILERRDAAEARGAKPLARVCGLGVAAEPASALERALAEAGLTPEAVGVWMPNAAFARYLQTRLPEGRFTCAETLCGDTAGAAFLLQLVLGMDETARGPVVVAVTDSAASVAVVLEALPRP